MTAPLISCLMPTYNRRTFIPAAIRYFQRQTYPNLELVILDDGEDAVGDLVPADPVIRYERLPARVTLGAKLNLGCEMARGDLLAHFDDDDWYAPWRLAYQAAALADGGTALCGINRLLYFDIAATRGYEYRYPPDRPPWLAGSDMLYTRDFWRRHRFADVNVGMDGIFAWSAAPGEARVLDRHDFAVHMIHAANGSAKQVDGPWWQARDLDTIAAALGDDWRHYYPAATPPPERPARPSAAATPAPSRRPPANRNVHACLVHEKPESVIDLVANLTQLDPGSRILLYDGSDRGDLLDPRLPWGRWGAEICPSPRPMQWGRLHGFALDCLRHLGDGFDTLTVVDSDQLALRPGYGDFLAAHLAGQSGWGVLSNLPDRQGATTGIAPCRTAQAEIELWRPFLRRFADGEDKFVHWSFWPGTVIAQEAGLAMLDLFDHDAELAAILERSRLWATEEVLFPTLAALLGYRVAANPCSDAFVKYRVAFSAADVDRAQATPEAFFIHPVPRAYADPLRSRLRDRRGGGVVPAAVSAPAAPFLVSPILSAMRRVDGWLEDEEAELLALTARAVIEGDAGADGSRPLRIVEIGSFCGKATLVLGAVAKASDRTVRITAVDRFDGVVGTRDRPEHHGPTLARFRRTLVSTDIEAIVDLAIGGADVAPCPDRVDLLLVDGLHDAASVAMDFHSFAGRLGIEARVLFHDYGTWFPAVTRFVDALVASGDFTVVAIAGSLVVLRPAAGSPTGASPTLSV